MAEYRYYTVDILSRSQVTDIPQYGVTMSKQMSAAGDYTGFFRLDSGIFNDKLLLDGTAPGRYALHVERDGQVIWGGPIWGRTYSAEDQAVQINASTYESVFERTLMSNDVIYQGMSPNAIMTDWWPKFQTDLGINPAFMGISLSADPVGTPVRTILIPSYEYHMHSDFLAEVIGNDGGYDYSINVSSTLDFAFFYANQASASTTEFLEFPGNIQRYWVNEAGSKLAMTNIALGAGSGNQLMKSINSANSLAGWPAWAAVQSFPNIGDQATLDVKAASMAAKSKSPVYEITVNLISEHNFKSWDSIGRVIIPLEVRDPRFPSGQRFDHLLTGWSLTPENKSGVEELSLVLEDVA